MTAAAAMMPYLFPNRPFNAVFHNDCRGRAAVIKNIDIVSTQSASDKLWCDDDYWQLLDACKRQSSSRLNAAAY